MALHGQRHGLRMEEGEVSRIRFLERIRFRKRFEPPPRFPRLNTLAWQTRPRRQSGGASGGAIVP